METKEFKALFLILIAQTVGLIYTIVPSDHYCQYFPFSDQELTPQSYVYFGCQYISIIVILHSVSFFVEKHTLEIKVFIYLQYIYLVDYLLSYNEAHTSLFGMHIDCDILRIIVMSGLLLKIIIQKWIHWEAR